MKLPLWIAAIFRRDLLLLKESPWGLLLSLASTVLGVLLFGLLGRFVGSQTGYVTFVLSGIAFLRISDAIVQAPGQGLREERSRGSLEVLMDSPRPPWALVLLSGIVPAMRSLIEGIVALTLGFTLFHADLHPGMLGLVAIPLAVATLLLLALATGLFFSAASMQSRAATAASTFFGLAVAMTAGVYYPRRVLPGWLQRVAEVSPFTAALNGLRDALDHGDHFVSDVVVALSSALVIGALGAALMNRAVRKARESGSFAEG